MGALKPWHLIILVLAFVILFGFKRLPDAARSIGRSMRIFKSEVDEMKAESQSTKGDATSPAGRATVEGERLEQRSTDALDDVVDPVTPPVRDARDVREARDYNDPTRPV